MATKRRKDNKGRALRKGESQRKDNTYMYRWTDCKGKRSCFYAKTLEALRKQEDKLQLEVLQGVQRDDITLNEMIERYLRTKKSLATNTIENYYYYFHHSIENDFIGKMRVRDIKKSDVLLYYGRMSEEHNYSNGSIHILHKILHPTFELAVDDDIILKNPSKGCMREYPQVIETRYALTFAQEQELLARIEARPQMKRYYPFFAIMLYTGLRMGEILGLTWNDVDMENRTINVNHQLQYRRINGVRQFYCIDKRKGAKRAQTKTESGKRILPMDDRLHKLFMQQRREWMKMSKDMKFEVDGFRNFVFLSHMTGRPLYPTSVRRMLKKFVDMNGEREVHLPDSLCPHILRHTACTRFAESGMDIRTVQYLMGHRDIKTTIRVYNHTDYERALREYEKYTQFYDKYLPKIS